mgnify:FL=1|tara:strand:- start:4157 stop:5221 length:1065 start_codon:yes stop_codon:yes gene_type:complete
MRLRILLSTLIAALVFTSCSSDPTSLDGRAAEIYPGECSSGNGRSVTIYSGRTENLILPVLEAFGCETGTDVQVRWGSSTDLALLINEEGDKTQADVFLSRSPGPVGYLESKGLLGTISSDVLSLVDEQNHSSAGTWVGFSGRKRVMVYNIDEYSPEDLPNSVFDLTGEEYRNKVALPGTNGSFIDWFTVFMDQHGKDVATQWLTDMVDNGARYYPNNRSIVEATGRGEIAMGLVNHYYNYQEQAANGSAHRAENYDFNNEDIGSLLIITAATILDSSTNVEASEDLLEYLLSAPVQQYFTDRTFEYPLAAGVSPNSTLPELTALEIGSVNFDELGGGFEEASRIIEASGILNR